MTSIQLVLAYIPPGTPPTVLSTATRLARRKDGRLLLLDVVSDKPKLMAQLLAYPPPEDFIARSLQDRRERMESRVSDLRDMGYTVEGSVRAGIPAIEIVRTVFEESVDLAVLGPEPKRRVYSGTTLRVLRNAPCLVWIARENPRGERPKRILAAVDPTDSGTRDRLNDAIVEVATSIASAENAELEVLHVWNPAALPAGSSARIWREWHAAARTELRRRVGVLVAPYEKKIEAKIQLAEGVPAEAITDLAAQREVDLVVMGTVCRTGVAGFIIGNTAEEALQELSCSVLAVKPEGFRSPMDPRYRRQTRSETKSETQSGHSLDEFSSPDES